MRVPSRFMPKYVVPPASPLQKTGWILGALSLLTVFAYLVVAHPLATVAVSGSFWCLVCLESRRTQTHRKAVAASRGEEGICEFARSFDCRAVDTWVVRAVFEELQEELGEVRAFPLKAADRFVEELRIDLEELDMTHVPAIAARTGRSLERSASNPYWGKVRSVADLVHFFNAQPMQLNPSHQRMA